MRHVAIAAGLLLGAVVVSGQETATAPATRPLTDEQIAGRVDAALVRSAAMGTRQAAERRELWLQTAAATVAAIEPHAPLTRPLAKAIASFKADAADDDVVAVLLPLLKAVRDDLRFKPRMEAAMPPGFPEPAPVGRVVVARYPAYRAAYATAGPDQADPARPTPDPRDAMFFRLFDHIRASDVKMTAPVEMTYQAVPATQPTLRPTGMAFLYERPDQGKTGQVGDIEVRDVAPVTVASLGVRGRITTASVDHAAAELRGWLKRHPEIRPEGEIRVLGYNSPFNLPGRMFFEVQVVIRNEAP